MYKNLKQHKNKNNKTKTIHILIILIFQVKWHTLTSMQPRTATVPFFFCFLGMLPSLLSRPDIEIVGSRGILAVYVMCLFAVLSECLFEACVML